MSDEKHDEPKLHDLIAHWYTVLVFARNKYAATGTKEARDSVTFAEAKMNQFEDQLLALKRAAAAGDAPRCNSGGCTQTMSTFGTHREGELVWLCGMCDLRECLGCHERVRSLTAVECPNCGYVITAPKSVDEELD